MIASRLRLGSGVGASERPAIVARLTALGASLRSVPDRYIDPESRLADRGGGNQRVTLECWTTRAPRLLATSTARVLPAALDEVRDELIRQFDDARRRTTSRIRHAQLV